MRRSAALGWLATAAATALLAAACGSGSSAGTSGASPSGSTAPRKVTIGVIPIIDVAPLYIGISKGIFSQHNLEVTPQLATGGAAIVPAVMSGENQFGFSNVVSLLLGREKGLKVVAVAAGASSTGDAAKDVNEVLVKATSPLKTAKDLEGKKVAVNTLNAIGEITIKAAVAKAGGDPTKVTFVEIPFPNMQVALTAGQVDAVWEGEPFITQIVGTGGRILFDNLTELYPNLQIAVYFTTEKMKTQDPKLVSDFAAAMNEAMTYATAHPEEVATALGKYTKITADVAAKLSFPKWPTTLDPQSAKTVGDAAKQFGALTKDPDVTGLLATS